MRFRISSSHHATGANPCGVKNGSANAPGRAAKKSDVHQEEVVPVPGMNRFDETCRSAGEAVSPTPSRVARRAAARLRRVAHEVRHALELMITDIGAAFVFAFTWIIGVEALTALYLYVHHAEASTIVLVAGGLAIVSAEVAVRLDRGNGPGAGVTAPVVA